MFSFFFKTSLLNKRESHFRSQEKKKIFDHNSQGIVKCLKPVITLAKIRNRVKVSKLSYDVRRK